MLQKLKNIAEWWVNQTPNKKLSILNLAIIAALCYLYVDNGRKHDAAIEKCQGDVYELQAKLDAVRNRYDDFRLLTNRQVQKMQEEINIEKTKQYKELEEKYERLLREVT